MSSETRVQLKLGPIDANRFSSVHDNIASEPSTSGSKKRKYNIMKINPPIDFKFVSSWVKPFMYRDTTQLDKREDNANKGLEFNREGKIEAWKRKKGFTSSKVNKDNLPWILSEKAPKLGKTNNKFIGRKEFINSTSSYFVLAKNNDGYEAFPVSSWYNFTRSVNFRYIDSEEAEKLFKARHKTLNHSLLMKNLDKFDKEYSDSKDGLVLRDYDIDNSDNSDGNNCGSDTSTKQQKSKKKSRKTLHKDSDDEALEDPDEGEFESVEQEYFSSTPSLSDDEQFIEDKDKTTDQPEIIKEQDTTDPNVPQGVTEDTKMFASSSDESEDEELSREGKAIKAIMDSKIKDGESSSDENENSDDIDSLYDTKLSGVQKPPVTSEQSTNQKSKSHISGHKRPHSQIDDYNTTSTTTKTTNTINNNSSSSSMNNNNTKLSTNKKQNMNNENLLFEREARKYLKRGPISSKTLVRKLSKKFPSIDPGEFTKLISKTIKSCNVDNQRRDNKTTFVPKN